MFLLLYSAALVSGLAAQEQAMPVDASPQNSAAAQAVPIAATLDTPIHDLIADPKTKAVLDRELPGMSTDKNLPKFEQMSLRQLQPMTGGQLTPALLEKVGAGLAKLSGGETAPPPLKPADKPVIVGR